jgi:methionine-rich copper-binding protein CopC
VARGVAAGLALLLFCAFAGGQARVASAHSLLDHADPPAGAKLTTSPDKLSLYFTGGLVKDSSWVLLRDAQDNDVPVTLSFDVGDHPKAMFATVPSLKPGTYTVKWQTLSSDDDDYVQDSYQLTVLNPDGSPSGGASPPASAPQTAQTVNHAQGAHSSGNRGLLIVAVLLVGSAAVLGLAGLGMRLKTRPRGQ